MTDAKPFSSGGRGRRATACSAASSSARSACDSPLSLIAGGMSHLVGRDCNSLAPSQTDVAELIAGIAALLVAVPALSAAWQSLRYPDLHGITDQLIALALIAAWAAATSSRRRCCRWS